MKITISLILLFATCVQTIAQSTADPTLLAEIKQIKAIDNHAHPMSADPNDQEYDAVSCAGFEYVSPPPLRLRIENPIYADAWRALYSYRTVPQTKWEDTAREVLAIKRRVMNEQGDKYPVYVLDRLNIETMFANRPEPGRGLTQPRFRWVGYGDPLMLPLNTKSLSEADSDKRFIYQRQTVLLKRNLEALKLKSLPLNFDQYLTSVVTPTIERLKSEGAIAIKFLAAYLRPLNFEKVSKPNAAKIYERYVKGAEPSSAEYKQLQDFLFRYIVNEAGRLTLPVHIHTGSGCGHSFNLTNSNPLQLESVLNDPALRKTTFVLIHGGYPFVKETEFLLEKPNVYADFSAQTFLLEPTALARVLREWLEYEPEKILFGTDASPTTPEVSWEESAWTTNNNAREALAIALTQMIQSGSITRTRATELAQMVLRDNARTLYKL